MVVMGLNALPGDNDLTRQTSGVASTVRLHSEREDDTLANATTVAPTRDGSITETASVDDLKKETAGIVPAVAAADEKKQLDDDPEAELQRRVELVHDLARTYTGRSQAATACNPFEAGPDSPLNPASASFSGRAWARALADIIAKDGGTPRTAGVAFQDMNVYGYGEATDYQKNVLNVWLTATAQLRRLAGNRGRRIDILQSFDGVVNKGEMLVVLGPPGSGCSTFLKTIAGETNGLYLDDSSYFNYQGE